MNVSLITGFVALLAAAALSARAESPAVVRVDGQPFRAELATVEGNWQLTFNTKQGRRTLPAAEMVRWGAYAEPTRGPVVVMGDGGLLAADLQPARDRADLPPKGRPTDPGHLKVDSDLFGPVDLPLERLAGVALDPLPGRPRRDRLLDRLCRAAGQSDRLLLRNGDELAGLIEAVNADTVQLRIDGRALEIKTHAIAALVFNPLLRQQAGIEGLRAWAGLADGSRLLVTRVVTDSSSLELTTAGGETLKTSAEQLVCLQPLGGRVTYLSDRKPAACRHVPYLDLKWPPYRPDRNVSGGWLRCGGRLYLKGLGVHSAARLTYELDEPYRRFQAELGIDDSTLPVSGAIALPGELPGGSVRFRVFVDGRQKYASQTVRGRMDPVPISVDVSGARRLDLIVDYADRADQLDRADWLDARLVR